MGLFHSLAGLLRVQLTSADVSGLLSQISAKSIPLFRVESIDDLTVQGTIYRKDYKFLQELTEHRGDKLDIVKRQGLYWDGLDLRRRPLLIFGAAIILLLALYLPSRILFVEVEGNSAVSAKMILDAAEKCGISFGVSRREVRSEKIKNALLEQIPELQWVGVNTSGCVATISVTEKSVIQQPQEPRNGVSSIVAARDGVIWECTVISGNPLCQVGQAVKAGQILVSGYTDCGIMIKAARAEAEIYAQTLRDLDVVTPTNAVQRGKQSGRETRYSLLIGKKLINLLKDSGISDTTCVKMYEKHYLTLPGGFQLPIGIVRETRIYYDCQEAESTQADSYAWLQTAAENYLQSQMVAGRILSQDAAVLLGDGVGRLSGQYACLEMIGQVKNEEILQR